MFTRPFAFARSAAGDPNWASVVLLAKFDGTNGQTTYTDSSTKNLTFSNGGASLSTTQKKFGATSLAVSGSSANIASPGTNFDFGSSPFTIEAWLYANNANAVSQGFITRRITATYCPFDFMVWAGGIYVLKSNAANNNWDMTNIQLASGVPSNTWFHLAIVGTGTQLKAFINGTGGTYTSHSEAFAASTLPLYIGRGGDGSFAGYIDEVRITKGVARYSSNFTAPAAEFPTS